MKGFPKFAILAILLAAFLAQSNFATIDITLLNAPAEGQISPNTIIAINAYVQSSAVIESASVEVAGLDLDLDRTSGSENEGNFVSTWVRNFQLPADLPDGPTNLVLTFRAADGESAVTNRTLTIATPPELTVIAPFENYVVHSGERLRIQATAFDEDTDVRIDVLAGGYYLARTNTFDVSIPFTTSGTVFFRARGSHGLITTRTINVIVQSNPKLHFVDDAPGIIVDVDATRILFQAPEQKLGIKEIGSGSDGTIIFQSSNTWTLAAALLTPQGALLQESDPVHGFRVIEVAAGDVTPLGPARRVPPEVAGNYAIWIGATNELIRRDLLAQTNLLITNIVGQAESDRISVAENGDVTFFDGGTEQVFRYRSGTIEQISTLRGFNNWTDGVNVLYIRERPNDITTTLLLHTPGGEVLLSTLYYIPPLLNNGWVAYTFPTSEGLRALVRAPSGELQNRVPSSRADALNEHGEVFFGSVSRSLSRPDGSILNFGSFPGRLIYRNEQWEVILGSALFRLATENHSLLIQPSSTSSTDLVIQFVGIPGTNYQIQTTTTLTQPVPWTDHPAGPETAGPDGSLQILESAPTTSRFYRAIQIQP